MFNRYAFLIDGTWVIPGDHITSFRGDVDTFVAVADAPLGGRSGRVEVTADGMRRWFYPTVYSGKIHDGWAEVSVTDMVAQLMRRHPVVTADEARVMVTTFVADYRRILAGVRPSVTPETLRASITLDTRLSLMEATDVMIAIRYAFNETQGTL